MFLKTVLFLVCCIILQLASALPLSSPAQDDYVLIKSNDLVSILRSKRDVALEITADANEPVDKDYDMELAEVNVFRPVFRIRSSYVRRGG